MLSLTPFLLFDGNCAEAMRFYQSCLGGDLTIITVGETPMKDQASAENHGKVAYAHLASDAVSFSATDWKHPVRKFSPGNTVAMYVNGNGYEELRSAFDRLAAGAEPALLDDLRDLPFGIYGHLADRYGVHWFFRGDRPDAGAGQ
jgi:PhnB protein